MYELQRCISKNGDIRIIQTYLTAWPLFSNKAGLLGDNVRSPPACNGAWWPTHRCSVLELQCFPSITVKILLFLQGQWTVTSSRKTFPPTLPCPPVFAVPPSPHPYSLCVISKMKCERSAHSASRCDLFSFLRNKSSPGTPENMGSGSTLRAGLGLTLYFLQHHGVRTVAVATSSCVREDPRAFWFWGSWTPRGSPAASPFSLPLLLLTPHHDEGFPCHCLPVTGACVQLLPVWADPWGRVTPPSDPLPTDPVSRLTSQT